ncbi:hypothetical protein [Streptomyces sp. NPDC058621]|uniref:hypothetical protein n=1 Tax=Streptomyces sp. NPDC058621 TaxID=3346561 RepID=UPI003661F3B7
MTDDLVAFLRHQIGRDLEVARTMGSLRVADDAGARLETVEQNLDNRVILNALADRYGGYRRGWQS